MSEQNETMRYASVNGRVASLSNKECVFQAVHGDDAHVMTTDVLSAMDACRKFATLQEHAKNVQERLPQLRGQDAAIGKVFEFLVNRGLFESSEAAAQRIADAGADIEAANPERVFVRTCDRTSQLQALLASAEEYQNANGRKLEYVVVDDSRNADARKSNAEVIDSVRETLAIRHVDVEKRHQLVEKLVDVTGVPRDQVTRLAGAATAQGFSGGQAWNTALLLGAGHGALLMDDDMRFNVRSWPGAVSQVHVGAAAHTPLGLFGDDAEMFSQLADIDGDPLESHIELCGAPLTAILNGDPREPNDILAGLSWSQVDALAGKASIRSTSSGAFGDSRMDTTLWLYSVPAQMRLGMWEDRDEYYRMLQRPLMGQGYGHRQLAMCSQFTPTTLDNRELVPPAAPMGRGEDAYFGFLLRFLHPQSLCANLPTLFEHRRPGVGDRPQMTAFEPWVSRFIGEFAFSRTENCESDAPADRAMYLAAVLKDLGLSSHQHLLGTVREFMSFMRSEIIRQLQMADANDPQAPEHWRVDRRDWIKAHAESLANPELPNFRDWKGGLNETEIAQRLSTALLEHAASIEAWVPLWESARDQGDQLI